MAKPSSTAPSPAYHRMVTGRQPRPAYRRMVTGRHDKAPSFEAGTSIRSSATRSAAMSLRLRCKALRMATARSPSVAVDAGEGRGPFGQRHDDFAVRSVGADREDAAA